MRRSNDGFILVEDESNTKLETSAEQQCLARDAYGKARACFIAKVDPKTLEEVERLPPTNSEMRSKEPSGERDDAGRLVMTDILRHKQPFLEAVREDIGDLLSLGMGADGEVDNDERIRILRMDKGRTCAEWHFHEDDVTFAKSTLSPSGKFIARFNRGRISIYAVPSECFK